MLSPCMLGEPRLRGILGSGDVISLLPSLPLMSSYAELIYPPLKTYTEKMKHQKQNEIHLLGKQGAGGCLILGNLKTNF